MPALELTLPQIAALEPDGTIAFNAATVSTVATAPQSFMIFYLTKEDEQNGYGTVIQLDEQHTAAIYPDLNPEYTYLFYRDEQGQLQTLLWCIEVATRNPDGLYVAQAKVHGRGVTQADMDRFNQIMASQPAAGSQAAPTHDLAETYSPTPATPAASAPISPNLSAAQPAFAIPTPVDTPIQAAPMPAATPQWQTPAPSAYISSAPEPAAPPASDVSKPQTASDLNLPPLPDLSQPQMENSRPLPENTLDPQLPAQPETAHDQPTQENNQTLQTSPLADPGLPPRATAPVEPTPQQPEVLRPMDAAPATPEVQAEPQPFDLPPLPQLPDMPTTPQTQSVAPSMTEPAPAPQPVSFPTLPPLPTASAATQPIPAASAPQPIPQPELSLPPLPPLPNMPGQPDQYQDSQQTSPSLAEPQVPNPEKNPVGRPPKPLMTDAAWRVDQTDFAWAKAISRESIEPHKPELRAKLQSQIERNQPELLQNPAFQPALDQAFEAVCQAYELAPTARQDLLKSLLNGRVVENIANQLH